MAISDTKQRMSLVIDKKDKVILEGMAKKDDRSVNYVINQAIKEFIRKNAPENKEQVYRRGFSPASSFRIFKIRIDFIRVLRYYNYARRKTKCQ